MPLTAADRKFVTERLLALWRETVEDFEAQLPVRIDSLVVLSVSDRDGGRDPGACACAVPDRTPREARYTLLGSLIAACGATRPPVAEPPESGSSGPVSRPGGG